MGRAGWAASVTAISPAGLWRAPLGDRAGGNARALGAGALRAARLARAALPPPARAMLATFAAHPERIPAGAGRELVLGWIDASGYDGANRAMRTHVFDPAGYPEDIPVTIAWGERDRLVGPPKPAPPPGRRPLPHPARRRPHATWDDPELVAQTLLDGSTPRPSRFAAARPSKRVLKIPARNEEETLIVERTENPQWLSNAYLVADGAGGRAC